MPIMGLVLMHARRVIVLAGLASLAMLVGCAATLDKANTTASQFTVASTPEQTYRNLVTSMRRCYTVPSVRVESDYFPDARSGALRLIWGNDVGIIEWLRVDISPGAEGTTVKIVHRASQSEFGPATQAWSRGDASSCPYA
ncbi:MAG: hypothetical protein KF788_08715 [Piscinibacter sp.]|nr:hypothetical protein [Piscinibacter sp.]